MAVGSEKHTKNTQGNVRENVSLLGAFAKQLRKATIIVVMSVYLPVCPHETTRLPPH